MRGRAVHGERHVTGKRGSANTRACGETLESQVNDAMRYLQSLRCIVENEPLWDWRQKCHQTVTPTDAAEGLKRWVRRAMLDSGIKAFRMLRTCPWTDLPGLIKADPAIITVEASPARAPPARGRAKTVTAVAREWAEPPPWPAASTVGRTDGRPRTPRGSLAGEQGANYWFQLARFQSELGPQNELGDQRSSA